MPTSGCPRTATRCRPSKSTLIKRWIAEGAKYDAADPKASLASIVPKLPQPDPPAAYRRPVPITALAFSPDGQELAASGYHEITIWNASDRRTVATHQERCRARLFAGLQSRWHAAGRGRRHARAIGRSQAVRPGRRDAGQGARHRWPTSPIAPCSIRPAQAGRRRRRPLDPHLRRRHRQAGDPDRRPRRLGDRPGLESRRHASWPRPAATRPRSCSTPPTASR